MENSNEAYAEAAILIRKPIDTVFEAVMNPDIASNFWFTKSTGRFDEQTELKLTWEMFNIDATVNVKSVEKNSKLLFEWKMMNTSSEMEWTFTDMKTQGTFVKIVNRGFSGSENCKLIQVRNSTEGLTMVLAEMKCYLEHNMQLRMRWDRYPKVEKSE